MGKGFTVIETAPDIDAGIQPFASVTPVNVNTVLAARTGVVIFAPET
jgi:hypothetical protein